jgi:hypothetical protein
MRLGALAAAMALAGLSAGFQLAPSVTQAQDASSKSPVPTPDEILRQLNASNWRQRQETVRQLVELGPGAQPVLRELVRRDLDLEARKNIELALAQIEESRLMGPSLITLHVKDASPAEVFANLSRQCGSPLPTWPDKLWDESNWHRLTLDYDRRPFWQVIGELGKQLQVDYLTTEPQEIRIARDSGHPPGGISISGAFLVTADPIVFRNGMNIELSVYGEPKVVVTRAVSFKLERAEDDHGNPLLPQTSRRMFGRRFRTGSRQLPMPFQRPLEEVNRIGRLKGTLNIVVQTATNTWQVHDPATMSATTRLVDSVPVTLESFFPARAGGEGFELQAALPVGFNSRGTQDEITELIRKRMKVLDENGHALSLSMVDSRGTNEGAEITADFTPVNPPGGGRVGTPAKIVWEIPAETRQLVVPFDFKDLPINDPFN